MKPRKKKSKIPKGIMKEEKMSKAHPSKDKMGAASPHIPTHRADMVYNSLTKGKK